MGLFLYMIFGLVSVLASMAGAICGIGGGVLIKPVLDAFGVLDVATISFLSGWSSTGSLFFGYYIWYYGLYLEKGSYSYTSCN